MKQIIPSWDQFFQVNYLYNLKRQIYNLQRRKFRKQLDKKIRQSQFESIFKFEMASSYQRHGLSRRYFLYNFTFQQVNDFMFSNTEKPNLIYIFLLTLAALINSAHSELLFLKTKSTNCTLSFQTSDINNKNNNKMSVVNCTRHVCLRNLMNGNCANMQDFQFGIEKCIQQCCGSNQFDMVSCQNYNEGRFARQASMDRNILIALSISLLGLIIAVIIFAVVYLKCCKKQQMIKNQSYSWKQCHFHENKECLKCKQPGAFLVLPCGTFYHLRCLNNNEKWACQHCQKAINRVKLFCPVCLNRCIRLEGENFQALDKKICELYEFHPFKCIEQMDGLMDTERKISESTKQ